METRVDECKRADSPGIIEFIGDAVKDIGREFVEIHGDDADLPIETGGRKAVEAWRLQNTPSLRILYAS